MPSQTITLAPGDELHIVAGQLAAPDVAAWPSGADAPTPAPPASPAPATAAPDAPEADRAAAAQDEARGFHAAAARTAIAGGSPGTYTVQPGDTLAAIATAIYGSTDAEGLIFDANRDVLGSSPLALPGTVLTIPSQA